MANYELSIDICFTCINSHTSSIFIFFIELERESLHIISMIFVILIYIKQKRLKIPFWKDLVQRISCNWSCRKLRAALWVLVINSRSSARAASGAVTYRIISPAPGRTQVKLNLVSKFSREVFLACQFLKLFQWLK